jgi:intracellular septation protein
VAFRWRWDGSLPWLALSTLILTLVLTGFGIAFEDETYVLIRPTVGLLAFGGILAAGARARPSLLERTLAYRLTIWSLKAGVCCTVDGWPLRCPRQQPTKLLAG